MHPHEHVVLALHVAPDEREVLLAVEDRLVDEQVKSPHSVGMRASATRRTSFSLLAPVADQVGDRDHQQAVLGAEALEVGHPGHRAVVVDDLAEHAGRVQAGHAGEVDGGLGVAGPLEHAAVGDSAAGRCGRAGRGRRGASRGRSSAWIVAARSAAEMPVVVPCR